MPSRVGQRSAIETATDAVQPPGARTYVEEVVIDGRAAEHGEGVVGGLVGGRDNREGDDVSAVGPEFLAHLGPWKPEGGRAKRTVSM